jgi:hypothetical protein
MRKVFEDSPGVETPGGVFLAYYNVLGVHRRLAREALDRAGIEELDPEAWYPRQLLLDVLRQIADKGDLAALFQVGKELARYTELPPEVTRFEDVLEASPSIYPRYQRNLPSHDYIRVERDGGDWLYSYHSPWPSQGIRGYLLQMFRKFDARRTLTIDLVEGAEDAFDRVFRLRFG